jgi:hypothetical protein
MVREISLFVFFFFSFFFLFQRRKRRGDFIGKDQIRIAGRCREIYA